MSVEREVRAGEGRPQIAVSQEGNCWVIAGPKRRVILDPGELTLRIESGKQVWNMLPAGPDDLLVGECGNESALPLNAARRVAVQPRETGYSAGVKLELAGFQHQGKDFDFRLQLFVELEGEAEELVCEVVAEEGETAVRQCRWPRGLAAGDFDHTVVPFMQGMLLPRDWPRKVWLYDQIAYGRGLYMPWWGHQQGDGAIGVILETPADGGCCFEHPEGGPTRVDVQWTHSLGRLRYPRRARFCFFERGNYVDLAKRYRRHVVETGHFVSLREKIARSPLVERLVGSPVVHTSILYHIQPESSYYAEDDPARNHQLTSFAQRGEELRKLASRGVGRAYVHLDGWGCRGYDNLHPDVLPPCPEAGGWEGLAGLADTCADLGYVLALHDQYRDYYHDAASYEPRHTILDERGERPFGNTWYGGNQSILCSRLAPGHVAKNYGGILARGIRVRGAYLDVFAVVPPDECYNPEHPVTRAECLKYRGNCFDYVRSKGGVISSEEPADWAIPHLDLVHHGPFALDPNPGKGPAMGIPVPLFDLVYHDAILLPWSLGRGAWGIPERDQGYLHGLLHAGMPYLSIDPGEEELAQVRTMCALHARVGLLEMTGHEFLEGNLRRQRTTFADGTRVTVDLDADSFEIDPPVGD